MSQKINHVQVLRDRAASKSVYAKQRDELNAAADYILKLEGEIRKRDGTIRQLKWRLKK